MKKDSIQTRKRKPKGQGKNKSSKLKQAAGNEKNDAAPQLRHLSAVTSASSKIFDVDISCKPTSNPPPRHTEHEVSDCTISKSTRVLSGTGGLTGVIAGMNMTSGCERQSTSPETDLLPSATSSGQMAAGMDSASFTNGTGRQSLSPGINSQTLQSGFIGSSPDSGIGAGHSSSGNRLAQQASVDIRSSPDSETFSPGTPGHIDHYNSIYDGKKSLGSDVTACNNFSRYSGSSKVNFQGTNSIQLPCGNYNKNTVTGGQAVENALVQQAGIPYSGLTAIYDASSASSQSGGHFQQFQPYGRYPGQRPSFVKSESAVI